MADSPGYIVEIPTGLQLEYLHDSRPINDIIFTVPEPPPTPDPPDITAPVVTLISPSTSTVISSDTALVINVTDDSGDFCRVFLYAYYPSTGLQEVVHDGSAFAPFYLANSSITNIANGFQYSLVRTGGWQSSPTLVAIPIDAAGNESS